MFRFSRSVIAFVVCAVTTVQVVAAQGTWKVVLADSRESIALDTSRIALTQRGITAWSRITLGREVQDPSGSYNAIEAENLYDCAGGRFTTLRRVYLRNGSPVREEPAVRERAQRVLPGSIDERLQAEACRVQPSQVALTSGDPVSTMVTGTATTPLAVPAQASASDRPVPVPADFRGLSGESAGARVIKVSDAAPAPEKPRMIELPKIDKEAAAREAAAAGVSMPTAAAKPADIHGAASAASSAAAAHGAPLSPLAPKPAVPALAAPRPLPAPVALPKPAPAHSAPDIGVSGHAREVMLATSGPKKTVKKTNPAEQMHAHWGYAGEGAPPNWGKLKPEFATCDSGTRQSPIDIRPGIAVDLEPIKLSYRPSKFTVIDNGHTVQVNVGAGNVINVMGKRFEMVQFHFHKPSEERVNGRPYPMVIHFVHKDWDDNLAVIAVLLDEGAEQTTLQTVWNHMPLETNSEVVAAELIDPMKLMPDNRAYWTYMGSLTTPPCSENVLWMVMKNPVGVSPEQIGTFSRLYKHNARPVQPNNGRLVKESR